MNKKIDLLTRLAREESTGNLSGEEHYRDNIYYAATGSGYRPIFKALLTNRCIYDCSYCVNRRSSDLHRGEFTPAEFARKINRLQLEKKIMGAFISSGVYPNPEEATARLYRTAYLLRKKYKFSRYLHVKIMPGTSRRLIERVSKLADRVSVNIETISGSCLEQIAPDKKGGVLKKTLYDLKQITSSATTQLMPGVVEDTDRDILNLSEKLYRRLGLSRVYYSSYRSREDSYSLKKEASVREKRLYQADFLLKNYNFAVGELLIEDKLPRDMDPKLSWALRNPEFFPREINTASRSSLLRVPGIGPRSAEKIISLRQKQKITSHNVSSLSLYQKSRHFLLCDGIYMGHHYDRDYIKNLLLKNEKKSEKLRLFSDKGDK